MYGTCFDKLCLGEVEEKPADMLSSWHVTTSYKTGLMLLPSDDNRNPQKGTNWTRNVKTSDLNRRLSVTLNLTRFRCVLSAARPTVAGIYFLNIPGRCFTWKGYSVQEEHGLTAAVRMLILLLEQNRHARPHSFLCHRDDLSWIYCSNAKLCELLYPYVIFKMHIGYPTHHRH